MDPDKRKEILEILKERGMLLKEAEEFLDSKVKMMTVVLPTHRGDDLLASFKVLQERCLLQTVAVLISVPTQKVDQLRAALEKSGTHFVVMQDSSPPTSQLN